MTQAKHCVFVHIGKTGGTSTAAYLREAVGLTSEWMYEDTKHLTASAIKLNLGSKVFDEALKFSIVRHPVDRYISACRQCLVDANDPKTWDKINQGLHPHGGTDREYQIFVSQVESTFVDGVQSCQIFKFEKDLPDGICSWLKDNGLIFHTFPHKLPPLLPNNCKQKLTPEALEFVHEFYACDYEAFSYEVPKTVII